MLSLCRPRRPRGDWGRWRAGIYPRSAGAQGAFAAKPVLFQTSPLAPGGGDRGPSRREVRALRELRREPRTGGARAQGRRTLGFARGLGRRAPGIREHRRRARIHWRSEGPRADSAPRGGQRPLGQAGPGPGRDPGTRSRGAGEPGAGETGTGSREPGRGAGGRAARARVTFPGGRAGGGGQRQRALGPVGSMWRLGAAAAAEGHREEGASRRGAPAPRPRPA